MNSQNNNDKFAYLESLKKLSEEDISRLKIEKSDLWYFLIGTRPEGPYCTDDVMNLIKEHHDFPVETNISSCENSKWVPLYHCPPFQSFLKSQKRGPKAYTLDDKLFVLKNGQRIGPYSYDEIVQQLKDHQFLLSDVMSNDEGKTWGKICEHPYFNRNKRVKELTILPDRPIDQSFDDSTLETRHELVVADEREKTSGVQGLLSLAFVGKNSDANAFINTIHTGTQNASSEDEHSSGNDQNSNQTESQWVHNNSMPQMQTWYTLGSAILLFSIGLYYFYPSFDPLIEEKNVSNSDPNHRFNSKASLPKDQNATYLNDGRNKQSPFTIGLDNATKEIQYQDAQRKRKKEQFRAMGSSSANRQNTANAESDEELGNTNPNETLEQLENGSDDQVDSQDNNENISRGRKSRGRWGGNGGDNYSSKGISDELQQNGVESFETNNDELINNGEDLLTPGPNPEENLLNEQSGERFNQEIDQ